MLLQKLSTAASLPSRDKFWLALLYPLSGIARVALLLIPFRHVVPFLGAHHDNIQLSPLATPAQIRLARRIGSFSALAARYTPWQSRCLVQAMMVKTLLNHYHIPYVLYLGVVLPGKQVSQTAKDTPPGLKAHAWVAVGPCVVAGRDGHKAFTVVSTFLSPNLLRSC